MSRKGWLVIGAFLVLLCADIAATGLFLLSMALAADKTGADALNTAMIVAWVAVAASLLWTGGRARVRLALATGPILIIVYMLAYTTFVEGNY